MSHEHFEAVVQYAANYMGLNTDTSEWKETSADEEKGPYGEMYDHRTFQHTSGVELHAISHVDDGDEWQVTEGGTLLYDLGDDASLGSMTGSGLYANFCPKTFWERHGYLPSDAFHDHEGAIYMVVFGLPAAVADDEVMEGNFALPSHLSDMASAHNYFQKLGFEYRDMQGAKRAAAAARKPEGDSVTPSHIFEPIIAELERSPPTADFSIAQQLIDQMEQYQDYTYFLEPVIIQVLERAGINDPLGSTYSHAEFEDFLARLKRVSGGRVGSMPASKAMPALQQAAQAAEKAKNSPADLSNLSMREIYRSAIRGQVPQIAAIGWCWDDERKGGATEDELAWYCGYVDWDGKLMRDICIPDKVFEEWFPEYRKATWNDYEPKDLSNYHTMPMPDEPYVEGVRALIASRYADRGAQTVPDMLDDKPAPITVVGSATVTRATPAASVGSPYAPTGASKVVTLKAFPAGHTGRAAPAPAPVAAPAPAPVSAPASTGDQDLWREYQMDVTALKPRGIERAGYLVVDTTPHVVFSLGFLDEAGGIVETIPSEEVTKLFAEYTVKCLDDGTTYQVNKLFGQQLSDLEKVVRERLKDVKIFDIAA